MLRENETSKGGYIATQTTSFTATNTPIDGISTVTAASVSSDLLALIADYNLLIGNNKLAAGSVTGTTIANSTVTYANISPFDKARVTRGSTQLIGSGSSTAMSWTSADYQRAAADMWIVGDPTKITIKTTGKYIVTAFASFVTNTTGYRQFTIRKNGTTADTDATMVNSGGADETGTSLSCQMSLTAGDYLELLVFQNSGGNLNISNALPAHMEVSLLP